MRYLFKTMAVIAAIAILMSCLPLSFATAVTAENTLIAQFSYSGGTASADIAGDKTEGYAVSLGDATVHASVNGADARKLEWTSDPYADGNASAVQPTMTAGSNNPWAVGAYVEVRLSTVGYTDLTFSAKLGGTKKGPRDFKLQYSTDGVNFTDVAGATYAITTNKEMQQAFDGIRLPVEAENAQTLYIRMTNTSDVLINGSNGLAGATGGETAVNDIVVLGTGAARFYPQGDVNNDYTASTADARVMLRATVGNVTLTDQQLLLSDVDGDGDHDTTDARELLLACANNKRPIYRAVSNGVSDVPSSSVTTILLEGTTASVSGAGATVSGNVITITDGGYYLVSGTLSDGQLIVAADDAADNVDIELAGVTMSCSNSSPIFVQSADNTHIILADGTVNTVTDTANYVFADGTDEPAAAIFSKDDLFLEGTGTLVVEGNYKNGITSKDDLTISGGTYDITAVNHGIRGKDSIVVSNADITIDAGADGMQSDNTTDTTRGYITIESGNIDITSARDGIQAETMLTVTGGSINVVSGGGSSTSPSSTDTESYKGIKGNAGICVTGGSITLNCKDDAVHSNGDVTLAGGVISAASGDDGVHADGLLLVSDPAALTVTKSYEAIEGVNITVTGGTMRLTSSDDGVNAAGGTDDNSGYWYVENDLLYVVSESTSGYQFSLTTDVTFDVNTSTYLVTDLSSTTPYDVVLDITSSAASGSPALSTDWYGGMGYEATDVASGYLPATSGSKTAALDLKGYFDWNGVPADGAATVSRVLVKLQGAGTLCLGALQVSDNDGIHYFDTTASGSVITSAAANGNVINLIGGVAAVPSQTTSAGNSTQQPGMGGMGGMGGEQSTTVGSLTMTGGYVAVYAGGDGIDINGSAIINGGTMIVHGPTDSGNGSLDFDGTFEVNGGIFVAAGSSGMLQTPSTSSDQYILSVKSSSSRSGGTAFGILDASGNTIVALKPTKTYQSVIISTPDIASGVKYTAYYGGSCAGSETDGLYSGNYTAGTSIGSATVSSIVTSIGSNSSSNRPSRP